MSERVGGLAKMPLALFCARFLEPGRIGLRIEFKCLLRIGKCLGRISGAIVVRAQVHMGRSKLSMTLLVQSNSFLISLKRGGIISESLLSEPQRIDGFDVRRIEPEYLLELLACSQPVVLERKQFAEIVVALTRVWGIVDGLFKFG